MKKRCSWCEKDELYMTYHDEEWGAPAYDDEKLFESLVLETFQSGLSWITILRKRENFRAALDGFDFNKIASYDENKIESLLQDEGIIRHRLKIKATIANAIAFMKVQEESGSFSKYLWAFVDGAPIQSNVQSMSEIPAITEISTALSKDLKKRGFKFVGPTVIYAFMQAVGMVNDHSVDCFRHSQVQ